MAGSLLRVLFCSVVSQPQFGMKKSRTSGPASASVTSRRLGPFGFSVGVRLLFP